MGGGGHEKRERSEPKVPPRTLRDLSATHRSRACEWGAAVRPQERGEGEGRKEGVGIEGRGCRDGDKRAATEKTVQAARAQVHSPVSGVVLRVPCLSRLPRCEMAKLKGSFTPCRIERRVASPRVASRFGSDETDDLHNDDDCQRCIVVVVTAVIVCDNDAVVVAV